MDVISVKKFYDKETNQGFVFEEWDAIRTRRERLGIQVEQKKEDEMPMTKMAEPQLLDKAPFDMFGIALSGGGIRSATFNLGFIKGLNEKGIFKYADYLSTVSGGGYIGSFIQKRLTETHDYDTLFDEDNMTHLKAHGDYLKPGKGIKKVFESLNFYINALVQIILHSVWYILFFAFILITIFSVGEGIPDIPEKISNVFLYFLGFLLMWYYFLHILRLFSRKIWSAEILFYCISSLILVIFLAAYSRMEPASIPQYLNNTDSIGYLLLFVLIVLGFFADPNILSLHRLYRFRLKDAFLRDSNVKMHEILSSSEGKKWTFAPYPLINTTLNLQGYKDIAGMKSCDYFLFSPLYSGSKLTGYMATNTSEYRHTTLATAMTISGAAVNPTMGYKSNRFLSFLLTLVNARLGYWALNPKIFRDNASFIEKKLAYIGKGPLRYVPTYWPYYNLAELFGKMNPNRARINLSDGGNIENLGAFELLRRKCKLIIASDAGADPDYVFSDLQTLLIRARNELEIAIEFTPDQDPEKIIRPNLMTGHSHGSYVIGKTYQLTETEGQKDFIGYFVYVKASVVAQATKLTKEEENAEKAFFSYKNYHPSFPHESTADQFFDETQWEAYETLGKNISKDLFCDLTGKVSIENLIDYFEEKLK